MLRGVRKSVPERGCWIAESELSFPSQTKKTHHYRWKGGGDGDAHIKQQQQHTKQNQHLCTSLVHKHTEDTLIYNENAHNKLTHFKLK